MINWDAIGAVGEIVGAVAVFLTLIYLAVQVRQSRDLLEENKKIALSQVYEGRANFRGDLAKVMMNNPEWASIFVKLRDGIHPQSPDVMIKNFDKLTDQEKAIANFQKQAMTQGIDNSLYQIELGLVDAMGAQGTFDFIRAEYPLWVHAGVPIPIRISKWYQENVDASDTLDTTHEKNVLAPGSPV